MKRFLHEKSYHWIKHAMAIALFLTVFFLFLLGLSGVSNTNHSHRTKALETAILRGIIHCYATEGHYPESLEFLLEQYYISYDTEEFFIDYQILGENIFPDITIIEK